MSKNKGAKANPLATVINFEFTRQLKKPSFWISILLIPVLLMGIFLIAFLTSGPSNSTLGAIDENTTILITDEAGILPSDSPLLIKDKNDAIEKLKSGDLDLYFYIPSDFTETKKLDFYHISEGLELLNFDGETIKTILKQTVSDKFDPKDVLALTGDYQITDNKLNSAGEDSHALGRAVVPLVILVVFFFFVCLFGNRLLMTVIEEKENRISEMILTSVSAKHLIMGKMIAMMLLGIIQILTVLIPLAIIVFIYRDNPTISNILSTIELDPLTIITNIILFVFSTFMVIGFCTYIGAITPTAKDASQFMAPVIVGIMLPLYFMQAFLAEPSGMVYFLTYFPISAPTALMLRNAFGTLTTPELIIGLVEIVVLSIAIISLTIRTFQKNAINFEIVKPKFLGSGSKRKKKK